MVCLMVVVKRNSYFSLCQGTVGIWSSHLIEKTMFQSVTEKEVLFDLGSIFRTNFVVLLWACYSDQF